MVEREKALDMALKQIEKQFGAGALMKLGEEQQQQVAAIPTGALSLDLALGIGGMPRGRVVELFGKEGSGKCVTADTRIWTDQGLETVEELFARCGQKASATTRVTDISDHNVRVVNENGDLESVTALTHNYRRQVFRIRLRSGRTVEVTENHPLRVINEDGFIVWRKGGEIDAGDTVVSAAFGAVESASGGDLSEDEAVLIGYLVAEGSLNYESSIRFTNWDPEVSGEFTKLMEQLFGATVSNYDDKEFAVQGTALRAQFAEDYGLDYVNAADKKVPPCIRTAGHKLQRAFLSALFEGDGWIDGSSTIGFASASKQLASEVQLLLYGFGIPATLAAKYNADYDRDYWTVTINPAAAHRFLDEIGFRSARRASQVEDNFRKSDYDPRFENEDRYTFEEVVAVEDGGVKPTFDIVVPGTNSFLANGMLSHNTTVALHTIAEAQKLGGIAAFIDAEHALDPSYAKALGVDVDELLVSQPDTGEQALEITDMLVRSSAVDIVVIDSVAALVPKAEIEGEMGDTHVGLQARLMSQAMRKLSGSINKSKTCVIFINQLRMKIGVMFGNPETTPGGRALKFYSSVRLDVRRIEGLKDGSEYVGSRVRVRVKKNKVAPPFKQAEFDLMYGTGISKEGSIIDVGVEAGVIKKAGAWYSYEDDQLGQGRENARQFLQEHDDIAREIEKKAKEELGITPKAAEGEEADEDADEGDDGDEGED